MELLLHGRFEDPGTAYAYQRNIFEEVAAGMRPPTISITPSARSRQGDEKRYAPSRSR